MTSINKTVRETAARMSQPTKPKGPAHRITVQKAKGGFITETEHGPVDHYYPPTKAVHKNLSSVRSHMAHAFNEADADET